MRRQKMFKWFGITGLGVLWIVSLLFPVKGFSYVAQQPKPGVLELISTSEKGWVVSELTTRTLKKSKREWVYFCVQETALSRSFASEGKSRCFYGSKQDWGAISAGKNVEQITYSLKNRIFNDRQLIPIGRQRYFYKILGLRPA